MTMLTMTSFSMVLVNGAVLVVCRYESAWKTGEQPTTVWCWCVYGSF